MGHLSAMNVHPKTPGTGSTISTQTHRLCCFPRVAGAFAATLVVLAALQLPPHAAANTIDWPQWRGEARDGVWRETGLAESFASDSLKPLWSVPVAGGYSGPTVAGGLVFVTDYLSEAEPGPKERIQCFGAEKGDLIWSHSYAVDYSPIRYQAGPRAAVLIHEGLAYSLGAIGHLFCLEAESGRVVWERDLFTGYAIEMPIWGIAGSPVIEDDLLIVMVGGKEADLVAFDRTTGEERWRALADGATYAAPRVIDQGGKRVVVAWTAQRIVGLEAATGKLLWEHPSPYDQWPIAISGPVLEGDYLVCSDVHQGTRVLRLTHDPVGIELVWHIRGTGVRKTGELHALISTPQVMDGHIYGADHRGILRCLELATGKQVWENDTVTPEANWATVHLIREGESDRFWLFNERGELIIARLSPAGYEEAARTAVIAPTRGQLNQRGGVVWTHPAFAGRRLFVRNDEQLVCVDLAR